MDERRTGDTGWLFVSPFRRFIYGVPRLTPSCGCNCCRAAGARASSTIRTNLSNEACDAALCVVRDVHCHHRGSGAAPQAAAPASDEGKQGARPPRWGRRRHQGGADLGDAAVPRVPEALQGDRWADRGLLLVVTVPPRRYPRPHRRVRPETVLRDSVPQGGRRARLHPVGGAKRGPQPNSTLH